LRICWFEIFMSGTSRLRLTTAAPRHYRSATRNGQLAVLPPLTRMIWPVM
jgi:hypothetical protein